MRYAAFGYHKNAPDEVITIFNGSYGCWGQLYRTSAKSRKVITSIHYALETENNSFIRCHYGVNPSIQDITKLMKAIIGDAFTFKVTKGSVDLDRQYSICVEFSDFGDTPRNHVMWYLFFIRCLCQSTVKYPYESLKSRGVTNLRQLATGCLLVCGSEGSSFNPVPTMYTYTVGGTPFMGGQVSLADVRAWLRREPLRGKKDQPFSTGDGYYAGTANTLVQSSVTKAQTFAMAGKGQSPTIKATFIMPYATADSHQVKGKEKCDKVFDKLVKLLKGKSLKEV